MTDFESKGLWIIMIIYAYYGFIPGPIKMWGHKLHEFWGLLSVNDMEEVSENTQ